MKRWLPLAFALAAVAIYFPPLSAQRPVFTTGTAAELAQARSIGIDHLRAIALPKGIEDANDLVVSSAHVDRLSMAHVRVQQRFQGIPVLGGEAIAHLNADGSQFADTDNLVAAINVGTAPTLTPDAAITIAVAHYGCRGCLTRTPIADLWIVRDDAGVDHLTYRVQLVRLDGTNQTALPVRFVDAHGGYVVLAYDNLQTATGTSLYSGDVTIGTSYSASLQQYVMENLTQRVGTFDQRNVIVGTLFRFLDPDDIWNDSTQQAAVDAHYATEAFLEYLQTVHGHNGLDGSGGPVFMAAHDGSGGLISAVVHYGLNYNNAFWDTTNKFASFGDGDGSDFSPLVTLDIVGHEMMHGVTQATANLFYKDQSGALSESWSDVFGALLERHVRGESANSWLIGEQAFTPGLDGDALRYLDNPHQAVNKGYTSDDDPDHYSELFICDDEPQICGNGGVHINSGIANKAFYLLARGGTHHLGGSMTGIGADAAAQIWFLALTSYMTVNTTFNGAREATTLAAEALYGSDSTEQRAVARAWCLVGVGTCVTVEAVSVSPDAGAGVSQTFTLLYSDSAGATDLKSARVRFATTANQGAASCSLWYNAAAARVQLMDDAGVWGAAVPLGSGTLSNSQCTVNLASSSATPSGNDLTLVLSITFNGSFTGLKNIYMMAASLSPSAKTGWVKRGTWTGSGVAAFSASPSGGAALRQSFTLQYADTQGASDLVAARVRFGISNANGCSARYNATNGAIGLLDDAGTTWTEATMGSGALANSQCTLNLASSTATPNGTALTVVLDITFSPSFSGQKPIEMLAKSVSGATTDWQPRATWTVPPSGPAAISVTPGNGTGLTQAFTLNYSDSAGAATLTSARVRFGASNVGPGTCTARYNAMTGAIQLLDDAGITWTTGSLGSGTLSNSQCTLNLSDSAATLSGTDLTLVLNITFSVAFAGQKNIYLLAADIGAASTGWQPRGTWIIPAPVVTVTSASPNAGAGTTRAFTLQYSDTFGGLDLSSARVRFAASNVGPGSCTARFNAGAGTIELLDDAGASWLPGVLGSGSLSNSQCTLNLTSSAGTVDDDDVTVVLDITFAANFIGLKNIYMLAGNSSGQTSGWLVKGSWTPHLDPNSSTAVDLGTLGGKSEARAVNNNGQTVGVSELPNGASHAFSWSSATGMVDLGTLGGQNSDALAVNASGQVVGWSLRAPVGQHAFLWTLSGGMVDIDARASGNSDSRANAISANGRIVGCWGDGFKTHAFSWTQAEGMVDLGTLGGRDSCASAVNDNGQVVGVSQIAGSPYSHAFSWTPAGGMIDLGTFGGAESVAVAVSESGEVVGYAATPGGPFRAFVWTQAGGMVDLGQTVGGSEARARAANNSGQIVGFATLFNGVPHPFSWTSTGGMVDLGTYGVAEAVNAHGQVVGTNGSHDRAFSWTPAGGLVDLGTLPGAHSSSATAINDHCQVVGRSAILGGGFGVYHAVLWNVGPCPTIQATSSR